MVSLSGLGGCASLCVFSMVLTTAGCEGGGGGGGEAGSSSTTSEATSTTSTETAAGSSSTSRGDGASSSSTTDDGTTTGSTTAVDGSASSGEGSSSTGDLCPAGTQNCPCDGGACEGGLECVEDTCFTPGGCMGEQQDAEPNDDEAGAQALPGVSCGDLQQTDGSSEPGDVDWFSLVVDDLGAACPNGDGTIAIVTADEDLEVCMYFACDAGAASVNCGPDDDATSANGLSGCCGVDNVEPNFFCSGVNNDSQVYLSVGGLDTDACVDYALAYRVL